MPVSAAPYAVAPVSPATPAASDQRSTREGLGLVLLHGAAYGLTLAGALAPLPLAFNIFCALANGVFIALLFILGHDAAHGSLVQDRRLNRLLARLCFIPCVHAVSLWRRVHNNRHHSRTNLKGVDTVWAPMSKAEYDAAHPARRWLERVYRSPWGPLFYYYGAFWIPHMLLPLGSEVRGQWRRHLPDSLFVLAGFSLTLLAVACFGEAWTPARPLWMALLIGWGLPFAIWNYLMAFTIYLNHTHPDIPWFQDEAEWRSYRGEADTTFVRMPVDIIPIYTKVMAHAAHHRHTDVPVYALLEAQGQLTASGRPHIAYTLTPGAYRRITRTCKLFDFERQCWTDFSGNPTR